MTSFVVKHGAEYVAFPTCSRHTIGLSAVEWTTELGYAWRWVGLESGNGARLTARKIGNGARVVKLVPKRATPFTSEGRKP
jgi:hypothetical protein